MVGRIPVMDVSPLVDLGRQPAKATVGEPFPVAATVFREGHDKLSAEVVLTGPDGRRAAPVRMEKLADPPDRYRAWVTPDAEGAWTFEVQAWSDPLATWQHDAGLKIPAGVDVELMFTEGRLLLERVLADLPASDPGREVLRPAITAAQDTERPAEARLAALQDPALLEVLHAHPIRELVSVEGPFPAYADRERALFGSWYEFFPRSEGATRDEATGKVTSGTLRTAAKRLDAVAEMGFDVIYLPPIHPIGEVNRKGPNNTLTPGPDDTGSPWAIGSKDGGHDAIHPDLGDFDDFDAFVARAGELGLEVALDLALQAAPDHPWVTEHPDFFTTRADGSIAYAENPPKKYQDIYPIDFDTPDIEGLTNELKKVLDFWIGHGVKIFRVDNPHTKALPFWEWVIAEIHADHPDVLFLAEAFTRPVMMQRLAKLGFTQSYTYFTWRNAKHELTEYLTELAHTDQADYFRPNFWPNTPDILHEYLQSGAPAAFKVRLALAALTSPNYGMYSGYELLEHVPVRPGSEEYLNSEKYAYRPRDFDAGHSIAPFVTRINEIRREHRDVLGDIRNIRFHHVDNDNLLVFSRASEDRTKVLLTVVNLDQHHPQEGWTWLDLWWLGIDGGEVPFEVHDLLTGQTWTWQSHANWVRLDPSWGEPLHVFEIRPPR